MIIEIDVLGKDMRDVLNTLIDLQPRRIPNRIARTIIPKNERLLDRLVDTKLRPYPPRMRHSPFIWSNNPTKQARARRWWWANKGGPHVRTGGLGRAWDANVTYDAAQRTIVTSVGNTARGASYVVGAAQFNFDVAPSHAATGWVNIGREGTQVLLDVAIAIEADLIQVIEGELTNL